MQVPDQKSIFATYIIDKGLGSTSNKELLQVNTTGKQKMNKNIQT